jgi:uncharacterized protein YjiS (DUF1127 family)
MSTLITHQFPHPAIRTSHRAGGHHLSNSWPLLATLRLWLARSRQRDQLRSRIDDKRLLDDIGLSREQVLRETNKAFWR